MVLKILTEFGIFAFAVVGIFVCVLLTEGRDTSDFTVMNKKIFIVFSMAETILMLSLFFTLKLFGEPFWFTKIRNVVIQNLYRRFL